MERVIKLRGMEDKYDLETENFTIFFRLKFLLTMLLK